MGYFQKYSGYFFIMGLLLTFGHMVGISLWRARNFPPELRTGLGVLFIIFGVVGAISKGGNQKQVEVRNPE